MPKENPELEQSQYQLSKEITQTHKEELLSDFNLEERLSKSELELFLEEFDTLDFSKQPYLSKEDILERSLSHKNDIGKILSILRAGISIMGIKLIEDYFGKLPNNTFSYCNETKNSLEIMIILTSGFFTLDEINSIGYDFSKCETIYNKKNFLLTFKGIKDDISKLRFPLNPSRQLNNKQLINDDEFNNFFPKQINQGNFDNCYFINGLKQIQQKQYFKSIIKSILKKSYINSEEAFEVKIPAFDPDGERITITQEDLSKREVNKNSEGIDGYQVIEVAYMKKYHMEDRNNKQHNGGNLLLFTQNILGDKAISRVNTYTQINDHIEMKSLITKINDFNTGKYLFELGGSRVTDNQIIHLKKGSLLMQPNHAYGIDSVNKIGDTYYVTITNPTNTENKSCILTLEELFTYFNVFRVVELDLDYISGKN